MLVKINVLTCDYIDFYKLAISQDKKTCETDAGQKSMYSHVSTVHSRFSDILFSDKPRFSDNFAEDRFFTT
jgi:hypothetical protein